MAVPVFGPTDATNGRAQSKTSGTSVGPATVPSRTWTTADYLVAAVSMDPASGGTVSFGAVTNFGSWNYVPNQTGVTQGSGTSGVRLVVGYCKCTTGYTGTAAVSATVPSCTAKAIQSWYLTGADGTTPVRGSATGNGTGQRGGQVTVTAGGEFDGLTVTFAGVEAASTGSSAATLTGTGWGQGPIWQQNIYGTTGSSGASNISDAPCDATKTGVAASDTVTLTLGSGTANCAAITVVFASPPATSAPAGAAGATGAATDLDDKTAPALPAAAAAGAAVDATVQASAGSSVTSVDTTAVAVVYTAVNAGTANAGAAGASGTATAASTAAGGTVSVDTAAVAVVYTAGAGVAYAGVAAAVAENPFVPGLAVSLDLIADGAVTAVATATDATVSTATSASAHPGAAAATATAPDADVPQASAAAAAAGGTATGVTAQTSSAGQAPAQPAAATGSAPNATGQPVARPAATAAAASGTATAVTGQAAFRATAQPAAGTAVATSAGVTATASPSAAPAAAAGAAVNVSSSTLTAGQAPAQPAAATGTAPDASVPAAHAQPAQATAAAPGAAASPAKQVTAGVAAAAGAATGTSSATGHAAGVAAAAGSVPAVSLTLTSRAHAGVAEALAQAADATGRAVIPALFGTAVQDGGPKATAVTDGNAADIAVQGEGDQVLATTGGRP